MITAALAASVTQAAADCVAPEAPVVSVTAAEAPLQTNRSLSTRALAERAGGLGAKGLGAGWHALGMTEVSLETAIDYGFDMVQAGTGACATFNKVAVTVTLHLVVNLAAELKPGSCAYQATEEHEQQHVDLEREMLPLLKESIAAAVEGASRRGATAGTMEAATAALDREMSGLIQRVRQAHADQKARRHAVFDTRAEYNKISLRCSPGEIRALLGY
ncbi:hypothetical protein [Dongia sp.]|uniref:hypothetical protein n=1 Tax=Dongia sp. TaxID=1977262 RepID=UPI003753A00E